MTRIERLLLGMEEVAGPGTSVLITAKHSDKVYGGGDSIGEEANRQRMSLTKHSSPF